MQHEIGGMSELQGLTGDSHRSSLTVHGRRTIMVCWRPRGVRGRRIGLSVREKPETLCRACALSDVCQALQASPAERHFDEGVLSPLGYGEGTMLTTEPGALLMSDGIEEM
jgi:hypothetical protein